MFKACITRRAKAMTLWCKIKEVKPSLPCCYIQETVVRLRIVVLIYKSALQNPNKYTVAIIPHFIIFKRHFKRQESCA